MSNEQVAKGTPRDLAMMMARLMNGYSSPEIMSAISMVSAAVYLQEIERNPHADTGVFLRTFNECFVIALDAILKNRAERVKIH